jgi:hypothetical protein
VPRKGLFPSKSSGTYADALRNQRRPERFLCRLPREENVSLQCHVPEWGHCIRLMLQCETAIRVWSRKTVEYSLSDH